MNTQKQLLFLIRFLYFSILCGLFYFFFKYWIYEIMPFLIGFAIAFFLRPIFRFLSLKTGISQRITGIITILLFYAIIIFGLSYLFIEGYAYIKMTCANLPIIYKEQIEPTILTYISSLQTKLMNQHPEFILQIQTILLNMNSSIQQIINSFSSNVIHVLTSLLSSFPSLIMSTMFAIGASFLFVFDYKKITIFFMKQFSPRYRSLIQDSQAILVQTLRKLLVAYGKLLGITFLQLTLGLLYLKVEHAIATAFLISIFDLLPVLGTSSFMIPWIIIELLLSHPKKAIGLAILSLIITMTRNIIEPKIIGDQIGLHPLVMLFCMYIGGKLFGFLGFLLFPIFIICIHNLNKHKKIHMYNNMDSS